MRKKIEGVSVSLLILFGLLFWAFGNIMLAVLGCAAGIVWFITLMTYMFQDKNSEYWREVEDLDQQKIYEDE